MTGDQQLVAPDGHPSDRTVRLHHVGSELALHQIRPGSGRPLLCLHGLGERTPDTVPRHLAAWPGPVWGLDFTGHGGSSLSTGGGYTAEILMADTDHALAHLGPVTVVGRGLGAYVALLIAGARPALVRGAILLDGPGLAGGGPAPRSPFIVRLDRTDVVAGTVPPDPYALVELANDVRPADYASTFARQAVEFSDLEDPVAVAATTRPPWLAAVVDEPGVRACTLPEALALYAAAPDTAPDADPV